MILSLDQRIQTLAYEELNKAVAYHKAKAGYGCGIGCANRRDFSVGQQPGLRSKSTGSSQ